MEKEKKNSLLITWLLIVTGLIFIIIVIGGITRLTGSGLSMVDWRPLMGSIPPITKEQWLTTFNLYKSYPQYNIINPTMTLLEFKFIFFWEYLHRMIARLIGLALLIPYIIFSIQKKIPKWLNKRVIIMILLVLIQGIIGWYMVKSGLVNRPEVSHYRLATHLVTALILLQYIIWTILDLKKQQTNNKHPLAKHILIWSIGIIIQIIYGAFTAGKKAGWGYNTYPKMGESWLPEAAHMYPSLLGNILENPIMIQFIHRHLGVILGIFLIIIWIKIIKAKTNNTNFKIIATVVLTLLILQILLGIFTLIYKIPILLAILHQLTGSFLLSSITIFNYLAFNYNKANN